MLISAEPLRIYIQSKCINKVIANFLDEGETKNEYNKLKFPISHKIDCETQHKWIFPFLCHTSGIFIIRIDNIPLSIDLFDLKAKAIQLCVVYSIHIVYVCIWLLFNSIFDYLWLHSVFALFKFQFLSFIGYKNHKQQNKAKQNCYTVAQCIV